LIGLNGNCDARLPAFMHVGYNNFAIDWKNIIQQEILQQQTLQTAISQAQSPIQSEVPTRKPVNTIQTAMQPQSPQNASFPQTPQSPQQITTQEKSAQPVGAEKPAQGQHQRKMSKTQMAVLGLKFLNVGVKLANVL